MKILITGGTGFIGSHILAALNQTNHEVFNLTRTKTTTSSLYKNIIFENLEEIPSIFEMIKPDVLIHLAAYYSLNNDIETIKKLLLANQALTTYLFQNPLGDYLRKAIFIGTTWQYEDEQFRSYRNYYTLSKSHSAEIAKYFCEKSNIDFAELRLADTFGINDNRKKLIQLMIESAISKNELSLSPGEQEIYLTDVEDVVILILKFVLSEIAFNGVFQMPGHKTTPKKISTLINKALGFNGHSIYHKFGELDYRVNTPLKINFDQSVVFAEHNLKYLGDSISKLVNLKKTIYSHKGEF